MQTEFSKYLVTLRKQKGFKRSVDLARATDIPATTLSDYELGKLLPPEENLQKLADALSVPFAEMNRQALATEIEQLVLRRDRDMTERSRKDVAQFYKWHSEDDARRT